MPSPPAPWTRLTTVYFLMGLTQAAHSMEEMSAHLYDFFWVVTGMIHSRFDAFPQFRMAPDTFAVLNMFFIALLLATVPAVRAKHPAALAFATVAAVIEIVNGIGHLTGAFVFRGYVPGALTAPFLILFGVLLLLSLRHDRLLKPPAFEPSNAN